MNEIAAGRTILRDVLADNMLTWIASRHDDGFTSGDALTLLVVLLIECK